MFVAVRFDSIESFPVHLLQLQLLCTSLEDAIHGSKGYESCKRHAHAKEIEFYG
jgi:hypothetical protein